MTGAAGSTSKPSPSGRRLWAAGMAALLASLAWGVWTMYSKFICALGGARGSDGALEWLAYVPALVLCAFGFLLWRRSPAAVLMAPVPLILWLFVAIAAIVAPSRLELSACALNAPRWWSDLGAFPLLFTLAVPFLGVLALAHSDPAAFRLGWQWAAAGAAKAAAPRNLYWALGLASAAGVATLALAIIRPVRVDDPFTMSFSQYPPALGAWDLPSRLSMLRIRWSMLEGAEDRFLERALERRLGPLQWSTRSAGSWGRVVTATGHFPPGVYRPPYEKKLEKFQRCVEDTRGVRANEKFIREWSKNVSGALAPAEIAWASSIFKRGEYAIPRRYESHPEIWCGQVSGVADLIRLLPVWQRGTADLLQPGEWDRLAALFRRRHLSVLYMTCFDLWTSTHLSQTPEGEYECPSLDPGPEEAFSRIVIEWWCVGIRCRWNWHDPTPWQRVSDAPCRSGAEPYCWAEWYAYLRTGRLSHGP